MCYVNRPLLIDNYNTMTDKTQWQDILKKAKSGDTDAQVDIATYYFEGLIDSKQNLVVKQNYDLAYEWYKKSADLGNINGIIGLADYFDTEIDGVRQTEKAIKLYKKAINLGSSIAAFNLATVYRDKGNYKKAFDYYSLSMTMENSDYHYKVGLCYYYGIGVIADKSLAIRHFKKVVVDKLNTHSEYEKDLANYHLGLSYLTGDVLKKSFKLAKKHFEFANIDNDNINALELTLLIGRNSFAGQK
jgi:TPR repeat protein